VSRSCEGAGAYARRHPHGRPHAKKSGIEAAGEIKDMLPHVKILMLTISDEEADLYERSRRARPATC